MQPSHLDIDELYKDYSEYVYRYILLLVHNVDVAEDLMQDTFIKVYRNLDKFQQKSSVSTWIIKIARNTVYDYLRKTKWTDVFNLGNKSDPTLSSISIEEKIEHKEEVEQLYTNYSSKN